MYTYIHATHIHNIYSPYTHIYQIYTYTIHTYPPANAQTLACTSYTHHTHVLRYTQSHAINM